MDHPTVPPHKDLKFPLSSTRNQQNVSARENFSPSPEWSMKPDSKVNDQRGFGMLNDSWGQNSYAFGQSFQNIHNQSNNQCSPRENFSPSPEWSIKPDTKTDQRGFQMVNGTWGQNSHAFAQSSKNFHNQSSSQCTPTENFSPTPKWSVEPDAVSKEDDKCGFGLVNDTWDQNNKAFVQSFENTNKESKTPFTRPGKRNQFGRSKRSQKRPFPKTFLPSSDVKGFEFLPPQYTDVKWEAFTNRTYPALTNEQELTYVLMQSKMADDLHKMEIEAAIKLSLEDVDIERQIVAAVTQESIDYVEGKRSEQDTTRSATTIFEENHTGVDPSNWNNNTHKPLADEGSETLTPVASIELCRRSDVSSFSCGEDNCEDNPPGKGWRSATFLGVYNGRTSTRAELFVPNEGFTYVRISSETAKKVKNNYCVRYLPVKHGEATMTRSLRCFSRFSLFKVRPEKSLEVRCCFMCDPIGWIEINTTKPGVFRRGTEKSLTWAMFEPLNLLDVTVKVRLDCKYDEMPYKKDGLIVQDVIQLNHVDAKGKEIGRECYPQTPKRYHDLRLNSSQYNRRYFTSKSHPDYIIWADEQQFAVTPEIDAANFDMTGLLVPICEKKKEYRALMVGPVQLLQVQSKDRLFDYRRAPFKRECPPRDDTLIKNIISRSFEVEDSLAKKESEEMKKKLHL